MGFLDFLKEEILKTGSRFTIPREKMPQIESQHLESFREAAVDLGISSAYEMIDPERLKPTQAEINSDKTDSMDLTSAGGPTLNLKPLVVSQDLEILDGHHRWWRAKEYEKAPLVWCLVFDCDIKRLWKIAQDFEHSFSKTIEERRA